MIWLNGCKEITKKEKTKIKRNAFKLGNIKTIKWIFQDQINKGKEVTKLLQKKMENMNICKLILNNLLLYYKETNDLIDFEKLSFTEYSNYLNHFTKDEKIEFEKGSFIDWAKESQDLRPKVYDFGGASESVSLSYEYNYKVKPTIELRLKQAGLRLASVLTKIFAQEKLNKDEIEVMKKIKENI